MENPKELGYRPALKKEMIVWTFDSIEDKQIVARRLMEYLPRDNTQ
jgi:hypothetical protein